MSDTTTPAMTVTIDSTPATSVPLVIAAESTDGPAASSTVETAATEVKKTVENDGHHALSHLEADFLAEWDKLFTGMHNDAKKLLAWVAAKL